MRYVRVLKSVSNVFVFVFGKESEKSKFAEFLGV